MESDEHLSRGWWAYKVLGGFITGVILLVFFEPTFKRLFDGQWQRGVHVFVASTSLDVHAFSGYAFVLALLVQFWLGFRLLSRKSSPRSHMRLGRVLVLGLVPLFTLAGFWVIHDRSTNIPPEFSVVFKYDRMMNSVALYEVLALFIVLVARSYLSIRRGDVRAHVDSMVGAFAIVSAIAFIRFLYLIFWAIRGGSPLSLMSMFFLTIALVVLLLGIVYAIAGRLWANWTILLLIVVVTVFVAWLGAHHYQILDRS